MHLRLSFYKKLATAKTTDQIDALLEEIVDRFGKLPTQAQTLIDGHRLRVLARPYGVVKVDAAPGVINITFKTMTHLIEPRLKDLQKLYCKKKLGWKSLEVLYSGIDDSGPRGCVLVILVRIKPIDRTPRLWGNQ